MEEIKPYINKYKFWFLFFFVYVIGLFTHGTEIFNTTYFHDALFLNDTGVTYTSGRWLIAGLHKLEVALLGSHINVKAFIGVFTFFFITVICFLIAQQLRIEKPGSLILLSAIVVTFPFVTSLFGYAFTAIYYYISMLLALEGAVLMKDALPLRKKWWHVFLGATLLGLAMSIYQTSLCMFAAFLTLLAIRETLDQEDEAWSHFFGRCGAYLCGAITGCIGYLVVNKVVLMIRGMQLSGYKGINEMGKIHPVLLIKRAIYAYKEFLLPARDQSSCLFRSTAGIWCYRFILLSILAASILLLVRALQKKRHRKALQLCMLLAVMPLATKSIFLTTQPDWIYELMVFSDIMIFALLLMFCEHICDFHLPVISAKRWITGITAVLLAFSCIHFAYIANIGYTKASILQENSIAYFNRLAARIQLLDGYSTEYPVAYINEKDKNPEQLSIPELDNIRLYTPYNLLAKKHMNDADWKVYMDQWCGFAHVEVSPDKLAELTASEAVAQMSCYPNAGSIAIIDGVIVVKFEENLPPQ